MNDNIVMVLLQDNNIKAKYGIIWNEISIMVASKHYCFLTIVVLNNYNFRMIDFNATISRKIIIRLYLIW